MKKGCFMGTKQGCEQERGLSAGWAKKQAQAPLSLDTVKLR